MRTYILTGAKGHLAGTVIRCLRGTDCQVRGLLLPTETAPDGDNVRYFHGDVTLPDTLEPLFDGLDPDETCVIHAAGIISIGREVSEKIRRVNVGGTRNMLDACCRHGVRRMVYVSSVHAIPEPAQETIIREIDRFSPDTVVGAYAKTKAEATQLCLDAAADGMDVVVVQPSGILGPYDSGRNHLVQLVAQYAKGKLPGGVTGGYDFVDVRDVARGCIAACDKGQGGACYLLTNQYATIMELFGMVNEAIGRTRRGVCFPLALARALAPLFELGARMTHTRPLFTRYALHTLDCKGRFSHEKADQALGFSPRPLRETVADTVAWLEGREVPLNPPVINQ